ncbi:hypothetical protein Mapa_014995 [Marchantia paleacea]|nr:hypothetical protein Mapa_014995 [Marchantia paleacea]
MILQNGLTTRESESNLATFPPRASLRNLQSRTANSCTDRQTSNDKELRVKRHINVSHPLFPPVQASIVL